MTTTFPLFTSDGKKRRIRLDNNRPVAEQVNEILDAEENTRPAPHGGLDPSSPLRQTDSDDDEDTLDLLDHIDGELHSARTRLAAITSQLMRYEADGVVSEYYSALVKRETATRNYIIRLLNARPS